MRYKLCILSAGRGTRNESISGLHKSLLPIENKATISHIIDKTPKDIPIVIAVGYKSDQIKSFINKCHRDRDIAYVDVDNYDKQGSGPGLSLLSCKDLLQCPFIFTCSDTITDENYEFGEIDSNWVGVSQIKPEESPSYCLIEGKGYVQKFYYGDGTQAYIGIAGISEYQKFWENLSNGNLIKNEHQLLNGFTNLEKIKIINFKWYDTGTIKSYQKTKEKFSSEIVAPKNDECIYIQNGFVVKYFSDKNKTNGVISRINHLNVSVPLINKINDNMISYKYIEGQTLASVDDETVLKRILPFWYENFGKNVFIKDEEFLKNCIEMYHNKTYERCKYFSETDLDKITNINGVKVDKINDILDRVNWGAIYNSALPALFHGDFQTENILYDTENNKFILIDWRISFGNSEKIGDSYYDLAKLYHGLLINGNDINNKHYKVKISDNSATVSHYIRYNLSFLTDELKEFCKQYNYSWNNVKLLTALNYLCMSSLYKNFQGGEFGRFLFLYGKYLLIKSL